MGDHSAQHRNEVARVPPSVCETIKEATGVFHRSSLFDILRNMARSDEDRNNSYLVSTKSNYFEKAKTIIPDRIADQMLLHYINDELVSYIHRSLADGTLDIVGEQGKQLMTYLQGYYDGRNEVSQGMSSFRTETGKKGTFHMPHTGYFKNITESCSGYRG